MYFLLDELIPDPHGSMTLKRPVYEEDRGIYHLDNFLVHFDDFSYKNFINVNQEKLLPKDEIKAVFTFVHMPISNKIRLSHKAKKQLMYDDNTYLVIMSVLETVITPEKLKDEIKKHNIPARKVIVLSSNTDAHGKFLCGIKYICINFWESYSRHHHKMLENNSIVYPDEFKSTDSRYKKKYLCLNRNVKTHRIWNYYAMLNVSVLNDGYTSYHLPKLEPQVYYDVSRHYNALKRIPENLHQDYFKALNSRMHPRVLDKIDNEYIINYKESTKNFYLSSCFSVITESDPIQNFITEKTYKAIMNLHPFFIIGNPDMMLTLRKKGYQTFEDMFQTKRVTNYVEAEDLWTQIKNTSFDDYKNKVYNEYYDKLVYNQQHYLNRTISWNTIVKQIETHIHEQTI